MGPTISTKSHETNFIKSLLCPFDKQKPNSREENNSVGVGMETKSKPAAILELQWFWPRGQMEVLSNFQLQVKFELNLYLYLLLHVQPIARGIHTPVCAPVGGCISALDYETGLKKSVIKMSIGQGNTQE